MHFTNDNRKLAHLNFIILFLSCWRDSSIALLKIRFWCLKVIVHWKEDYTIFCYILCQINSNISPRLFFSSAVCSVLVRFHFFLVMCGDCYCNAKVIQNKYCRLFRVACIKYWFDKQIVLTCVLTFSKQMVWFPPVDHKHTALSHNVS